VAADVLREAVEASDAASAAVSGAGAAGEAFRQGLRRALASALDVKGLVEMMHGVLSEWMAGFIADIEAVETTQDSTAHHTHLTSPERAPPALSSNSQSLAAASPVVIHAMRGMRPSHGSFRQLQHFSTRPRSPVESARIEQGLGTRKASSHAVQALANGRASWRLRPSGPLVSHCLGFRV
jgi:hypothetical protein